MRPPQTDDLLDVPDEDDRDYAPPPPRSAAPDESDLALNDMALEDDAEQGGEGGPAVHKKIPTWQDAVGILIDANMAARANSPQREHRGRRGRGGR